MTWSLDHIADSPWGRIAWGRAGRGPALVLAHGWPWSSFSWSAVIPTLASRFAVHWYDMPGFGRSDPALDRDTGIGAQGEILAWMLDHWRLDAPSVWAHDFGGAVTLRAHLLHDRPFARILLMNVVAMRPWGSAFFDHVGRHIDAFTGLPPHIHRAVVCAYIDSALMADLPPATHDGLDAPWLTPDGQRAFYRQFAQADEALTEAFEPHLHRVTRPVHILWGADDPWIPLARGHALARAVGCRIEPLPGIGHMPQLEAPEAALARALPFLDEGAAR